MGKRQRRDVTRWVDEVRQTSCYCEWGECCTLTCRKFVMIENGGDVMGRMKKPEIDLSGDQSVEGSLRCSRE